MSGFSFRPRGPERAPRNQLGSPVPGATPALRHPGHTAELSISVPAAAAVPLQGAASPCRPPPPAHGWTPLLHGLTFSGHMSPRMTSSVTAERSPVTSGGRLAGHPSSDRSLASPAGRHAPPTADGSQSPAPADGAGRSLSAGARSPPAVRRQSYGAENADVVSRARAESDERSHGDRGATVRTEKSVLELGVTPDAVRGSPNVCSDRVSSGVLGNGGPPRPLFRPYCDNVVSRTRDGATVPSKRNEREDDEKCGERRSKSPQQSAKGAAVGGETAPASAISGEADEPGAEGDISGAGGELPDCCRTRPLSQTWVRYSEWCRRRKRRRSAAASSDVIGDVTPDQMISISGLGPFAAPGPGPGAEMASPGAGDAGRPVAVSSAPRTVLPATASGGKLVGIAKARQREPECAAQPTVLTSIAGRLSLPGFGGPVWTGAAPGRDLTGAAWGVPGSPAPQPAPLPPMWLGPTPQPYAATQLYTSYQVQLHSDPATGHLMLVPRSVEPAPRPTVLWSPYQCVSPLQSPQLTVLPSQPPQLYIQATSEQTLLTSTGAQVIKKEEPTSRLKPIQPAPSHVAPSPAGGHHPPPPPVNVQYIIPAPLQSVYYTHAAEPPASFILQPAPAAQPQHLAPGVHHAAVPGAPGVHSAVPAPPPGVQHPMQSVGQLPLVSAVPVLAPEPLPAASSQAAPSADLGGTVREVSTRSQATSPVYHDQVSVPAVPDPPVSAAGRTGLPSQLSYQASSPVSNRLTQGHSSSSAIEHHSEVSLQTNGVDLSHHNGVLIHTSHGRSSPECPSPERASREEQVTPVQAARDDETTEQTTVETEEETRQEKEETHLETEETHLETKETPRQTVAAEEPYSIRAGVKSEVEHSPSNVNSPQRSPSGRSPSESPLDRSPAELVISERYPSDEGDLSPAEGDAAAETAETAAETAPETAATAVETAAETVDETAAKTAVTVSRDSNGVDIQEDESSQEMSETTRVDAKAVTVPAPTESKVTLAPPRPVKSAPESTVGVMTSLPSYVTSSVASSITSSVASSVASSVTETADRPERLASPVPSVPLRPTPASTDPLQVLAGCAADLRPLPPVTVAVTVISPVTSAVTNAVTSAFSSAVTNSVTVSSSETTGGLHLLCEAASIQRPTPVDHLATLLAAAHLLSSTAAAAPAQTSTPSIGPFSALCEVAEQHLSRVVEPRVFFVPPRWEMWKRPAVDPAGRRDYRSVESAEIARDWLRRRAAGNGAAVDQMQVRFTIEPFWEDSPRIQELHSKLADIQRLYRAQLKLHRLSPRKNSSESPAKRRPSVRGARRSAVRRRSDSTRTPPRASPPPVAAVSSRQSEGAVSDTESEEGGLDVWEDTACADTISYSFSSRRENNYSNGIRALAECKKRHVPQTSDFHLGSDPARKKRKLCPPKKHSFSPDDTETIVAKKKCYPLLKPKLKPKLKAEVIMKDSFSDGEEPPPPPPPPPPVPTPRKRSVSKDSTSSKSRSVSREAPAKRQADSREAGGSTPAKRRKSSSDAHAEKHRDMSGMGKTERSLSVGGPGYSSNGLNHSSGDRAGASTGKSTSSGGSAVSSAPGVTQSAPTAAAAPTGAPSAAPQSAAPSESSGAVNGLSCSGSRDPALSAADLSEITQLLVLIDGLFYRSRLEPIQPPDLYGVTVEGERCHRPNIYTQEQLLNQAVREVRPASFSSLTPGTRVLANWSPKLRGLFPGTVTEGVSPEPGMLYVEFDDGDSGYMRLEGIRMLPANYPTVEHDQDPLDTLSRRRRRASSGTSVTSSQRAASRQSVGEDRWEPHPPTTPAPAPAPAANGRQAEEAKDESIVEEGRSLSVDESTNGMDGGEAGRGSDGVKGKKGEVKKRKKVDGSLKKKGDGSMLSDSKKHLEGGKSKKSAHTKDRKTEPSKKKKSEQSKKSSKHEENGHHHLQNGHKKHHSHKNGDEAPKKKKKKRDSADGSPPLTAEERAERKKKKAAKRRESAASDGYVVEQESDLKLRIKSPSPSRKQEKEEPRDRHHSAEGKKKKKGESNRQRHPSGMAAFLPERQLWDWDGKGVKRSASKGKAKREVYKAIVRGSERIAVGDCAVFLSAGLPDRPYVGRIQALWETTSGQMLVQVAWFYHPEETCGLDRPLAEPKGGLFESPHMDDNDVQTISHRCQVLSLAEYRQTVSSGDNETFYRAGFYDPRCQTIRREPGV